MRKTTAAVLLAGLAGVPLNSLAQAPAASQHTFAFKVSGWTEYEYRGISQTSEKPAAQLNIDYSHASGFYLGTFVSNIKWLKDIAEVGGFSTSANIEWDIFGGYKFEIAKDVVLDVGYLRYEYPSSGAFNPKPNTDEVYIGIASGPFSAKYSYSINETFGVPNSEGSDFIEANLAYPVADKWTLTGHLGHQRYKGTQIHGFHNGDLSYTVYKLGVVYDFGGGWNAGGYVKGTDAEEALYTVKGKDWGKERLVAFVSYTF
jgi:uncharacterized protein (TIGR02001 family)